jgi:hypothetical protein
MTDATSDVSVAYGSSGTMLALSGYANAANFFSGYTDATDCGALTCELKQTGCTNAWTDTTNVAMDASSYAVTVKQNVADGQVKTLCVKCQNTGGLKTATHDSWVITQVKNCEAVVSTTGTVADKSIAYSSSSTLDVVAALSSNFFTNADSATCGALASCEIKASGCTNAYSAGNLVINASTGKLEAKQNVDAGYDDTVCIKCSNTAFTF